MFHLNLVTLLKSCCLSFLARVPSLLQKCLRCGPKSPVVTSLQSMTNVKLSKHRIGHCYENRLIKTTQTIPHNLKVSVKLTSFYCGLRLILVYPMYYYVRRTEGFQVGIELALSSDLWSFRGVVKHCWISIKTAKKIKKTMFP